MTNQIKFVPMIRTSDGDGPHPIHPDEVENYKQGGWTIVIPATLTGEDRARLETGRDSKSEMARLSVQRKDK